MNKKFKKELPFIGLFLTVIILLGCIFTGLPEPEPIIIQAKQIEPTPTPSSTEDNSVVLGLEDEIKEVFGEHTEKAMLLLKGKGVGTCAENRTLNPEAINRNWIEGQSGKYSSSDWGVFQINDKWQGVTNTKFLLDPSINIRMAWRIFEDSGYTFKMWTCGKVWGI